MSRPVSSILAVRGTVSARHYLVHASLSLFRSIVLSTWPCSVGLRAFYLLLFESKVREHLQINKCLLQLVANHSQTNAQLTPISFCVSTGCDLNETAVELEGHSAVVVDKLVETELGGG